MFTLTASVGGQLFGRSPSASGCISLNYVNTSRGVSLGVQPVLERITKPQNIGFYIYRISMSEVHTVRCFPVNYSLLFR